MWGQRESLQSTRKFLTQFCHAPADEKHGIMDGEENKLHAPSLPATMCGTVALDSWANGQAIEPQWRKQVTNRRLPV